MRVSKNEKVQAFLKEQSLMNPKQYALLEEIREMTFSVYPEVEEKIMYGGIMFSLDAEDFSGVFVRKEHVSLEFGNGSSMQDPQQKLEGKGKFRRHLKFRSQKDLIEKDPRSFIQQAK